jgi:hypothetical protein
LDAEITRADQSGKVPPAQRGDICYWGTYPCQHSKALVRVPLYLLRRGDPDHNVVGLAIVAATERLSIWYRLQLRVEPVSAKTPPVSGHSLTQISDIEKSVRRDWPRDFGL